MRRLSLSVAALTLLSLTPVASPAASSSPPPRAVGTDQLLSVAGGTDDVALGIDPTGTATAVWSETYDVRVALRQAGGRFGPGVAVPGVGTPGELAYAESPGGTAAIAWVDLGGAQPQVRISVRRKRGQGFSPARSVSGPFTTPSGVDVAVSDSGRVAVAWHQGGAMPSVVAALVDGPTVRIRALESGGAADRPRVGLSADGTALAVWDHDEAESDSVQGARALPGQDFGASFLVEALDQGPGSPELAVNGDGLALLAYEDAVPDTTDCSGGCSPFRVEARRGPVTGALAPLDGSPTGDVAGYGPANHQVALGEDGSGALLLSWVVDSQATVAVRTLTAAGALLPVQTLSAHAAVAGPTVGVDGMEVASEAGTTVATWINDHDEDGSNDVWESVSTGGSFSSPVRLSASGEDDPEDVVTALDPAGRHVALWNRYRAGSGQVPWATPTSGTTALTIGTSARDVVVATGYADHARTGGGNDSFTAGGGPDVVSGEGGDDTLLGGGGPDRLLGGAGDDTLKAGTGGRDVLDGGPGRDVCHLGPGDVARRCERVVRG